MAWYLEEGWLTGFVIWGGRPPDLRIHQIYVYPSARRLTIATSLLTQMLDRYPSDRWSRIWLRCAEDLDSLLFWQACGFVPTGLTHHSQWSSRRLIIFVRFPQCKPPAPLYSPTYFESLAPGLEAISVHSPSTPREAESSCGILAARQLCRPASLSVVNAIDSHWRCNAGELCQQVNASLGSHWQPNSGSSQPATISTSTLHSTTTPTPGKRPPRKPGPYYFPPR